MRARIIGGAAKGPMPGSAAEEITRGVIRLMLDLGFAPLAEFPLTNGRRVDVCGLDRQGRFAIVEVKSSLADFTSDAKWPEYLEHCDFYYFAVGPSFPLERLPEEHGLIVADAFGGAVRRHAFERPMNGNRRRTQSLRFARTAASRLAGADDPAM